MPALFLSPLIAIFTSIGLGVVIPEFGLLRYVISSVMILAMCTLWVMWAWRWDFWRAFSSACMAAILQVATSALAQISFLIFPSGLRLDLELWPYPCFFP